MAEIVTIGLDIAKSVFQVHGVRENRQQLVEPTPADRRDDPELRHVGADGGDRRASNRLEQRQRKLEGPRWIRTEFAITLVPKLD
jgi:hypothetical protein